jgi:hypothetical protein
MVRRGAWKASGWFAHLNALWLGAWLSLTAIPAVLCLLLIGAAARRLRTPWRWWEMRWA